MLKFHKECILSDMSNYRQTFFTPNFIFQGSRFLSPLQYDSQFCLDMLFAGAANRNRQLEVESPRSCYKSRNYINDTSKDECTAICPIFFQVPNINDYPLHSCHFSTMNVKMYFSYLIYTLLFAHSIATAPSHQLQDDGQSEPCDPGVSQVIQKIWGYFPFHSTLSL